MVIEVYYLGCVIPESVRVKVDNIINSDSKNRLEEIRLLIEGGNENLPDEEKVIVSIDAYGQPNSLFKKNDETVGFMQWDYYK